mmetsp:Transcript_112234/g.322652  ORF Transcript_112234/g.322652 Transcript_112234/m.322652 type:complete len:254 (-) Transcript_112234:207-968(-)
MAPIVCRGLCRRRLQSGGLSVPPCDADDGSSVCQTDAACVDLVCGRASACADAPSRGRRIGAAHQGLPTLGRRGSRHPWLASAAVSADVAVRRGRRAAGGFGRRLGCGAHGPQPHIAARSAREARAGFAGRSGRRRRHPRLGPMSGGGRRGRRAGDGVGRAGHRDDPERGPAGFGPKQGVLELERRPRFVHARRRLHRGMQGGLRRELGEVAPAEGTGEDSDRGRLGRASQSRSGRAVVACVKRGSASASHML